LTYAHWLAAFHAADRFFDQELRGVEGLKVGSGFYGNTSNGTSISIPK